MVIILGKWKARLRSRGLLQHKAHILNSNLAKCRLHMRHLSIVEPLWKFEQRTAVSLSRSVQIFQTIWELKWMFWTNERDLSLGCVLVAIPYYKSSQTQRDFADRYSLSSEVLALDVRWCSTRSNIPIRTLSPDQRSSEITKLLYLMNIP